MSEERLDLSLCVCGGTLVMSAEAVDPERQLRVCQDCGTAWHGYAALSQAHAVAQFTKRRELEAKLEEVYDKLCLQGELRALWFLPHLFEMMQQSAVDTKQATDEAEAELRARAEKAEGTLRDIAEACEHTASELEAIGLTETGAFRSIATVARCAITDQGASDA